MEFFNPVKINKSPGIRKSLVSLSRLRKSLIICSDSFFKRHNNDKYLVELFSNSKFIFEHNFSPNPSLKEMTSLSKKYSNEEFNIIIGIGGGSSMDVAKILSVGIPPLKRV